MSSEDGELPGLPALGDLMARCIQRRHEQKPATGGGTPLGRGRHGPQTHLEAQYATRPKDSDGSQPLILINFVA